MASMLLRIRMSRCTISSPLNLPRGSNLAFIVIASAVAVDFLFADGAPGAAVAFEKLVRFDRAPRTRGGIWEAAGGEGMPDVDHRLDYGSAGFQHVGALEQRGGSRP